MNLKDYITNIPDFPKKGIIFRDITTLLSDGEAFSYAVKALTEYALEVKADVIVAPEARGFIVGAPVATALNLSFVPARKTGKLPRETISTNYILEYGDNVLTIHKDAIKNGQRVLIIDDLIATGGTIKAVADLCEQLGGIVVGVGCIIELEEECHGVDAIKEYNFRSLIKY